MSFVITRLEAFPFRLWLISREELKKIDAWLTFGSFQTSSRLLRQVLDDLFFVWNREIQDLEKMLLLVAASMFFASLWSSIPQGILCRSLQIAYSDQLSTCCLNCLKD